MFNIGFETEFVGFMDKIKTRRKLREAGFNVNDDYDREGYVRYTLTEDGSIRHRGDPTRYFDSTYGHELVSPIMPIKEGMRDMRKVFKFLKDFNCETNESTGFHLGISFEDAVRTQRINRKVMVFHAQELELLKLWGRESNGYCASHTKLMISGGIEQYGHRNIRNLLSPGSRILPDTNKYRAFNFGKLNHNYIECRIMGGKDYHLRYRDILMTVKTICRAMIEASEANAAVDPLFAEDAFTEVLGNRYRPAG